MKRLTDDEAAVLRQELAMASVPDESYLSAPREDQSIYDELLLRGCIVTRHVVYLKPNPEDDNWFDEWRYDRPIVTSSGRLALLAYDMTR